MSTVRHCGCAATIRRTTSTAAAAGRICAWAVVLALLLVGAGCSRRPIAAPAPAPTPTPTPAPFPPPAPAPVPGREAPSPGPAAGATLLVGDPDSGVETLSFETYVAGVVAGEVPLGGMAPDLAARVGDLQAILARTFALANRGRHRREGYDMCRSTHCQVFRPAPEGSAAAERAEEAVRRTAGLVVMFDGRPIQALYHSDCGGRTSDAADVWGGTPQPYLVGVDDPACARRDSAWRFAAPTRSLVSALDRTARTAVGGRLLTIDVVERDDAGRVKLLTLAGRHHPLVRGEELRGVMMQAFGAGAFRSTRFSVTRDGGQFVFDGRGRGHGVGLCQLGAIDRLQQGAAVADVLTYYYPATHVLRAPALTRHAAPTSLRPAH